MLSFKRKELITLNRFGRFQLLLVFLICISLNSCNFFSEKSYSIEKENAIEYNDFLVRQIDTVSFKFIEFIEAFNQSYTVNVLEEIRQEMSASAEFAIGQLNEVKPYQNETAFINTAKNVLSYYKHIADKKLFDAIEILRKEETGEITEADYEAAFQILYEAEVNEFDLLMEFDEVQAEFIDQYHQML